MCSTAMPHDQLKREYSTESDINEDKQELNPGVNIAEENEKELNEDMSLACASVVS